MRAPGGDLSPPGGQRGRAALRRSLAWITLSQGGLTLFQFASSVALARLLTPFEMGVYAIGAATIGLLAVFQAFGLALFIIREPDLTDRVLDTAFTLNAVLCLALCGSILLLGLASTALFHEPGIRRVMVVLAIIPVIGIGEFLPAARLEREAAFGTIAVVNIVRAFVGSVATVTMAFAGYSSLSMAWGGVAGALAGTGLFMALGRPHNSFRLGLSDWRRLLRFGLQQLVIQGINNVAARVSEIALGRFLGLGALGLYGRASALNNLFYNNVNMIVGRVVLVEFAAQRRAGGSLRSSYLRVVEMLTGLLWPCFGGLAILGAPLIDRLYGPAWLGAAPALSAMAIASMLLVSITMTWEVFVVCNETGRQARFEFARTGAGLILFVGASFVSVFAAAASRIVEALISVALYRPHLERMTDTRWADVLPIYRRSAALTVAACGPAMLMMAAGRWSPAVPLALLVASIAGGVLAWLLCLWWMDHVLLREVRLAVARIWPTAPRAEAAG